MGGPQQASPWMAREPPDAMQLAFEDDGLAFDPLDAPDPVPAASLVDAPTGGCGLMFTQRVLRWAVYERMLRTTRCPQGSDPVGGRLPRQAHRP